MKISEHQPLLTLLIALLLAPLDALQLLPS
jgi:hypothetical protein